MSGGRSVWREVWADIRLGLVWYILGFVVVRLLPRDHPESVRIVRAIHGVATHSLAESRADAPHGPCG